MCDYINHVHKIDIFGGKIGIVRENQNNIIAFNALAAGVTSSSATAVLNKQDKRACHKEENHCSHHLSGEKLKQKWM